MKRALPEVKVVPSQLPALAPALERMKQWLQQPPGLYLIAGKSDSGRTWAFSALMDQVLVNEKVKLSAAQDPIDRGGAADSRGGVP